MRVRTRILALGLGAALGLVPAGVARAQTSAPSAPVAPVPPPQIPRAFWPQELPPRPLAARDVKFPPYQTQTLPNGLQIVAVLHHEQPVVSMRMIVRAGSALDPRDKLGVAELTAALLTQGTQDKTAKQINEEVDFMGGAMGGGAGTDLSFLNIVVMKDSFETGLRMLSDMARRPAFAPEEIDRQRQQMLSGLQVSLDDPGFIANAVFERLVFGFHPYGMPQTGTPDTLAAITREDILAFHRRTFVPNNTIIAVVGDVTAAEAFEGVKKVFGDWAQQPMPAESFMAPPEPTRRVVIVNKPDAVQTEVRAGHIGIKRNHPDYMALNLAIRILGGEGANRLHQNLRTARGLTYGAQADMHTMRESGAIEASTNTRSEATGEVLRLMVDEFWRLQRERVRERELADAKAYITGSFPLTIETPDAIATQVLNVLFYGLPVEELQSYRERVNAVTPDDIARVAREYLRPDRLSIVLVGNAAAFTSQLRTIGYTNVEVVEMPELDLTAADFKARGSAGGVGLGVPGLGLGRPRLRYQAGQGVQRGGGEAPASAQALLTRVIEAKGGLETLRGIKSITAVTSSELTSPSGPIEARTTTHLVYPNRVRVETVLPDATIVQGFDGATAWIRDPKGIHDVTDRARQDLEAGFKRDTIALLLAAADGSVRARLLPDVTDDAGRRHHALELAGSGIDPIVLYVDPKTHLIERQTYAAGGLGRALVEEVFSDYKTVDGVQIAFSATILRGGTPVLERKVRDIRINAAIDPGLFARPSS
ncbi:MAG: insulinase family protein [Vicinamibacterales bacterium]